MARKRKRQESSEESVPRVWREYSDEFKSEAVQMMLDGSSAQTVANNLGISNPNLLYRWKEKLLNQSGTAATTLDHRVRQLEEQLRRVERKRDILKKALAIFSQS